MSMPASSLPESAPSAPPRNGLLATFRFRDFRLLWFGLLVSNLGTWMQLTALGYLVVSQAAGEADAALRLGYIGLSQAIPALIFSPIAGVVADRVPRKTILLITNLTVALSALALAVLVTKHITPLAAIMSIAVVSSTARAFDSPARQSWVPLLVDRSFVSNAIGLNSLAFNLPSAIGPTVAGFLIGSVSLAGSFYANAALTLAVVVALLLMKPAPAKMTRAEPFFKSLAEGVRFLFTHPVLRWIIVGLCINSLLLRPYIQLLPAFVIHVLKGGPKDLGILLGASGAGAIIGALTTAVIGAIERRARLWTSAAVAMGFFIAGIGAFHETLQLVAVLVGAGFSTMVFVGSSNILIQTLAPDAIRGRAISAFSMIILGLVPLGSMVLATGAGYIGLRWCFAACGITAALMIGIIWFSRAELRDA